MARKGTMFRVLELFVFRVSAYKFAFKYILVLNITHDEFYWGIIRQGDLEVISTLHDYSCDLPRFKIATSSWQKESPLSDCTGTANVPLTELSTSHILKY